MHVRRLSARIALTTIIAGVLLTAFRAQGPAGPAVADEPRPTLDPSAWGGDHVGQPIPEFVSGDECLFCHRQTIGATWSHDPHGSTVRPADAEALLPFQASPSTALQTFAGEAELMLGRDNRVRLLKRSPAYGSLAILSTGWTPPAGDRAGTFSDPDQPHWQDQTFGRSCAGCHATAVDAETSTFSALSLDCFACHGDASLDHTNDSSQIHLAKRRNNTPREVISICGQCHLRGGTSRSTGRPYPNNFVAGDNLFRDFQVDFSEEALGKLDLADRHILENVRDVAVHGESSLTCLSCHQVHGSSSEKHQALAENRICLNCHDPGRPKSEPKTYQVHSRVCGY